MSPEAVPRIFHKCFGVNKRTLQAYYYFFIKSDTITTLRSLEYHSEPRSDSRLNQSIFNLLTLGPPCIWTDSHDHDRLRWTLVEDGAALLRPAIKISKSDCAASIRLQWLYSVRLATEFLKVLYLDLSFSFLEAKESGSKSHRTSTSYLRYFPLVVFSLLV